MIDVYVGLGSNMEPADNLRRAIDALGGRFGGLRCSSVYESPPYGFTGDDFFNLVTIFSTALAAQTIEEILSSVEHAGGRQRDRCSGPRTLDLDLLLYGMRVNPAQRLPRDDVLRYPFVLAPLAELAPDLTHPVAGCTVGEAWRRMAEEQPPLRCLGQLDELV